MCRSGSLCRSSGSTSPRTYRRYRSDSVSSSTSSPHTSQRYPRSQRAMIDLTLLLTQNIGHCVQPGWLPRQKHGGGDGTADKTVAVEGTMAEFERFSHQAEDDSVLSGLITGSHGVDPDFITGALSNLTLAAVHESRDAGRLGRDLGQPQRRAAGCIFLQPMMPFHDLDIRRLPQGRGRLAHQPHQKVHRPAHVGRNKQRNLHRNLLQLVALRGTEARRADDHGDGPVLTETRQFECGRWM